MAWEKRRMVGRVGIAAATQPLDRVNKTDDTGNVVAPDVAPPLGFAGTRRKVLSNHPKASDRTIKRASQVHAARLPGHPRAPAIEPSEPWLAKRSSCDAQSVLEPLGRDLSERS